MTLDEISLRASGLTDMGGMTKDDDGCCFPYVYSHFATQTEAGLKKAREPQPPQPAGGSKSGNRVKRELR